VIDVPFNLDDIEDELARRSLSGFTARLLGVKPAYHHQVICNAIDDLLADEYDELIILAPPGSAKSTYTSIGLPNYFLGRYPTGQILTASYSSELAEKWGRRCRNLLKTAEYQSIFPSTKLSPDSGAAGRWATDAGGEFYAAGVGSGILGFRADLAVIDDPISGFEQAQSETQLAKVHEWYETDFVTRLKPSAKTVLICQRLARNDLAGYLIDRNVKKETKRQRILKIKMVADEHDILGRRPGERLWPEWFTEEMVEDAQRDDFKWRTLYQQEPPTDTGAWVSTEDIKFAPAPDHRHEDFVIYGMTDLALSIGKGDYTVHIVVALNRKTGEVHPVDFWRERSDVDESSLQLVQMCAAWRPVEWLIDDDNASKVFMQLVATESRSSSVPVRWTPMPMRGKDKETRNAALRGMFKRGMIVFDPAKVWTHTIIGEALMFPNATGAGVDDCIDSLGLIGRRLSKLQMITEQAAPKPRPTVQEMTLNGLWDTIPKSTGRF
jgi:predicted phage terminase large subunit-like protein